MGAAHSLWFTCSSTPACSSLSSSCSTRGFSAYGTGRGRWNLGTTEEDTVNLALAGVIVPSSSAKMSAYSSST